MNLFCLIFLFLLTFIFGLFIGIYIKNQETKRLVFEKNELKLNNDKLCEQVKNLTEINSCDKIKLDMFNELQKLIKEDFSAIANKVIKEEQSDLREQNREALEEKLKPLKENFDKFKEKVEEFNKQGGTNTEVIKSQIELLLKESSSIRNAANDLSNALKANSQARGVFGEMILENLLEQSGLINKNDDTEKGNYITQHVFKDLTNASERPKPDAVVFFPNDKNIIIDAKCPLNNFVEFINTEEETIKQTKLKLFYKSVTDMIEELSSKYNTLEGLNTPEFKLMFIPLESCASYVYTNKEISEKAAKQNIIIVCPSTLLATLKIINKVWTQKNQSENLNKILKSAAAVYEKLVIFIKKAEDIRKNMFAVQTAFDSLFATATGKGGFIKHKRIRYSC